MEKVSVKDRTDHKGVVYSSLGAMCREYGISIETYRDRILKQGCSKEEALTTPNKRNTVDHLGNVFATKAEMLKHYGLSETTFKKRLDEGMTLEEALTTEVKTKYIPKDAYYDHLGNKFGSLMEMLVHYGIGKPLYYHRVNLGWSLEQILTVPIKSNVCKDFCGKGYTSLKAMCKHFNIGYSAYTLRVKNGMDMERALLLPSQHKDYKDLNGMRVYKEHFTLRGTTYFKCKCLECGGEFILNAKDLVMHDCKKHKQMAA